MNATGPVSTQRLFEPTCHPQRCGIGTRKQVETLSAGITLYPGDVIATGTPVGVGIGFKPPKYLAAGNVVRIEIDGIGSLENPVR